MCEALDDHEGSVSIGGRLITNFRFADDIVVNAEEEEEAVENFKYLGAIISNEGSKPEILSRITQTTAALSRLKIIWKGKNTRLLLRLS